MRLNWAVQAIQSGRSKGRQLNDLKKTAQKIETGRLFGMKIDGPTNLNGRNFQN